MGSMCGSGGGDVQRQTSEPSDWAKGFLTPGMDEAKRLFGEGPAKHYTEDNGSAIYGFGSQTNNALDAMYSQGMNGAQNRQGATNALNMFTSGGAIDGDTTNAMRSLGLGGNAYQQNPVYNQLAGLNAGGGMNLSKNLHGRIGSIADGGDVDPMRARMEGLMSGGGMNHAQNLFDRTKDLIDTGGNVGGYSRSTVGDITASGAGSNSQIRGDINDLITGQAQAANPAFTSLGLTSSGAYLGGSPFLDSMYDRAADRVTRNFRTSTSPAIDGRFAMTSGGSGSGAAQIARDSAERNLGDTLSGLATDIYGGDYGRERDRQLSAASTLGSQYLQGQGLRSATAGQSAAQAAEDARLRLAATGQVAGDMSGDAARRMQASQNMLGAEQADWSNLMGGMDRMSNMRGQDLARQMQAAQQMTGAEQTDWQNLTGNLDRMSNMYDTGADRNLATLRSANDMNLANRSQQLQSLGLMPTWQQMESTDIDRALGAGGARDALEQKRLDERVSAFDFGQNAPWSNVQRYLALTGGGNPGTTTSMTGGGPSPLANILQGIGGAGSIARLFKPGWFGG